MLDTVDVSGTRVRLDGPATRIVSLVPSITETVIAIAGPEVLVGRTRYCIHPADEVAAIPRFGGTKDPRIDEIIALRPGLVLANREENLPEHIAALREAGLTVHVSEPRTVVEGLEQIMLAGTATGELGPAMELFNRGVATMEAIQTEVEERRRVDESRLRPRGRTRAGVLIWREPWMVAGGDTFISAMLGALGLENAWADASRYPEVSVDDLRAAVLDLLLLPSEPWKFGERDAEDLRQLLGSGPALELVVGEDLMWPGARTPGALARLWAQLGKWAR